MPENPIGDQTTLASGSPAAAIPLGQDRELLEDFLHEGGEHLTAIEACILELERDAENMEAIHSIFRSFHTLKGIAGFLDLLAVRDLCHEVEALLDLARNKKLTLTPVMIDVILASKDFLVRWCESLSAHLNHGREIPNNNVTALIERLQLVAKERDAGLQLAALSVEVASTVAAETTSSPCDPVAIPAQSPQAAPAITPEVAKPAERVTQASSGAVKVDLAKLDFLVDMVGEMMIAQSLVRCHPLVEQHQDSQLSRNLSQLARITSDLQKTAMAMRMVPVGQLFQKMVRLVRDLAKKSGKSAILNMDGENTELDRNLVEALADPLMHMVRNAVDHGLETPDGRKTAGKPVESRITLRAMQQSGCIVVEVADDGRGLNRERILQKAIQNGLVTPGSHLSDADVYHLIFQPGFSTAEKVTDVSGRGVGMDVVKKQIQKLRGRIEIVSELGKGTTFSLKLPLTLAIVDGLVVRVGTERFILPIYTVREMLRPDPAMIQTIEARAETLLLRGEVIPLVRLSRRLGISASSEEITSGVVVLLESESRRYGLVVDELIGKQEVVIKALGEMLSHVAGIAGSAILGDGRVGLILDPEVILKKMGNAA